MKKERKKKGVQCYRPNAVVPCNTRVRISFARDHGGRGQVKIE